MIHRRKKLFGLAAMGAKKARIRRGKWPLVGYKSGRRW
jgi:hypothetical protein